MEFQKKEKRILRSEKGPIIVGTLSKYIGAVIKIVGKEKKHLWYRGHGDIDWPLIPSIQRSLKDFDSPDEFYRCERYSTNNFQSYASSLLQNKPAMDDFSAWLTLMQHYGLHTRLLDWSRSPLYALYFATHNYEKHHNKDACIWMISPYIINKYSNLERKTYAYYHMQHKTAKDVVYTAFREYFPPEDCSTLSSKERSLHARYMKDNDAILACFATETDPRVFNQQSVFTIHSTLRRLTSIHDEIKKEWDEEWDKELLIQIVIPAQKKKDIFRELSYCGITHSNVFPDLEHVAMDIRNINPWA